MSRITLVTSFDEKELNKIDKVIQGIGSGLCKVPYGIDDERRYEIDNLSYHLTVFATNKENEDKVLDIARSLDIGEIEVLVDSVHVMNGRNGSLVLYLGIVENADIKRVQRVFYDVFKDEKYNPDKFLFHITLHIDKNKELVYDLERKVKENFVPFSVRFGKLSLYNYPGEIIEELEI